MATSNGIRIAQTVANSIVDENGVSLCHGLGGFSFNLDNKRHAVLVGLIEVTAHRLGWRASNGRILTVDGGTAVRGHGVETRTGEWDLSHDVADGGLTDMTPGPACLCNLYPETHVSNASHVMAGITFSGGFDRAEWDAMARTVMLDAAPFSGAPKSIRDRIAEHYPNVDRVKFMPATKRARAAA